MTPEHSQIQRVNTEKDELRSAPEFTTSQLHRLRSIVSLLNTPLSLATILLLETDRPASSNRLQTRLADNIGPQARKLSRGNFRRIGSYLIERGFAQRGKTGGFILNNDGENFLKPLALLTLAVFNRINYPLLTAYHILGSATSKSDKLNSPLSNTLCLYWLNKTEKMSLVDLMKRMDRLFVLNDSSDPSTHRGFGENLLRLSNTGIGILKYRSFTVEQAGTIFWKATDKPGTARGKIKSHVLDNIRRSGSLTRHDIAKIISATNPKNNNSLAAATKAIHNLFVAGYISPVDFHGGVRLSELSLTPLGKKIVSRFINEIIYFVQEGKISPSAKETIEGELAQHRLSDLLTEYFHRYNLMSIMSYKRPADERRNQIVRMLSQKRLRRYEIAKALGADPSWHIKDLLRNGVIGAKKEGRKTFYFLTFSQHEMPN